MATLHQADLIFNSTRIQSNTAHLVSQDLYIIVDILGKG